MSFKIQDTTVINDSREAVNIGNVTVQGTASVLGPKTEPIQTISCSSSAGIINCSLGNYFELTDITQSTTTIDYISPAAGLFHMVIKVNPNTSTFSWPLSVTWKNSTTPTMTSSNTHFVFLYTIDGISWKASFLTYT